MTPSERTLSYYRNLGYIVGRVERDVRVPSKNTGEKAKIFKQDFLGCIDYIAISEGEIVGIQSTVASERQRHINKIMSEPRAHVWTKSGAQLHLVCWRTLKGKWVPIVILFDNSMGQTIMSGGLVLSQQRGKQL